MPDQTPEGAGGVPPGPTTPPAPSPPVPEQQPAAQPQPTAPTQATISRDQSVLVEDGQGQTVQVTLGQLADAYKSIPDQSSMEDVELWKKAVSGDEESTSKLLQKYSSLFPSTPTAPVETPTPQTPDELKQLQEKLQALEESVQTTVSPFIENITNAAVIQGVGKIIQEKAEEFPLLSKMPEAAKTVYGRWSHYDQLARSQNVDLLKLNSEQKMKVLNHCMSEVETSLKTLGSQVFGSDRQKTGPVAVEDQDPNIATEHQIPARYQMKEGQLVDTWAQTPNQPSPQTQQTVPTAPVTTPVTGGAGVGATGANPVGGMMTVDQFRQVLRDRTNRIGGTL